ncbi:MAG: prephenate dehydrogenase/arogenate dehydrogenase family protein [Planctomycetota bacterium]|jgi:prephenate dehydrogenase|nr:MAG: prephenate dehydrogenase/arogenate dehydrogenase family protein [Planctomycetota bacterium]
MKAQWPTVAIVGVGMIGGSIGKALLGRRLADRVIGVSRSAASSAAAKRAGAVSETTLDLAAAAAADLVVVAAGVAAIPGLLDALDALVKPGTLITDAGSTKTSIVANWERRRRSRRGRFVGSHPIAGSHRRGAAAADAGLFTGRVAVVTPVPATPPRDAEDAASLWAALGSTVFMMPPREHDRILAATSHAPHLLAAAIVAATPPATHRFTAGGWRDTTRIAAGDPELWADILLDNAAPVASAMKRFAIAAEKMLSAIEAGDRGRLVTLLRRAKDARDAVGS